MSTLGKPGQAAGTDEPKARKACINCRKQKMKCRVDKAGSPCRRCLRAGTTCIFVPRANASVPLGLPTSLLGGVGVGVVGDAAGQAALNRDVLRRLKVIEEYLDIGTPGPAEGQQQQQQHQSDDTADGDDQLANEPELAPLWQAVERLERMMQPRECEEGMWARQTIKLLWESFNERNPGFHFLPHRQTFSAPHPLLLASILYYSSTRAAGPVAGLSPQYFAVLCRAISQLSIPGSDMSSPGSEIMSSSSPGHHHQGGEAVEEWAFQTVLAILLAGLLSEGIVRETGTWISIALRIIVDHCPQDPAIVESHHHHHMDVPGRDWRRLFVGVQIVDLEHASLHMTAPVIPLEPPIPYLRTSSRDQLYRLSRMMYTGLSHFAGRGLPTIWSRVSPPEHGGTGMPGMTGMGCTAMGTGPGMGGTGPGSQLSPVDAAVIRDWARQLDDWLVEFRSKGGGPMTQDSTLVFRQYVLHRLVVLSIYHQARGCNLVSSSASPGERRELALSARACLKLHRSDKSIWSNWDLVMITWAALIVIQATMAGDREAEDVNDISMHLDMLKNTNQPQPSLRNVLALRLESELDALQQMRSLSADEPSSLNQHSLDPAQSDPAQADTASFAQGLDLTWQLFDQASLEQMPYYIWADSADTQSNYRPDGS